MCLDCRAHWFSWTMVTAPGANQRTARRLPLRLEVSDDWLRYRGTPRFQYRRGGAAARGRGRTSRCRG